MPTKRRRIPRMHEATQVGPARWAFFGTGEYPKGGDYLDVMRWHIREDEFTRDWLAARYAFLEEWIAAHPGTRPWAWWLLHEPRRRVGGRGTSWHEVHGNAQHSFKFGLATYWVDAFSAAYYNGRARDVDGRPIGTEHREGQFIADAYDPDDPPTFESQAAYLERHGLLTLVERRRLTTQDFAPEAIAFDEEKYPSDPVGADATNDRF